ncbi:MAG: hypothetical protein WAT66_09050 [Actinomycetota bacterium]
MSDGCELDYLADLLPTEGCVPLASMRALLFLDEDGREKVALDYDEDVSVVTLAGLAATAQSWLLREFGSDVVG